METRTKLGLALGVMGVLLYGGICHLQSRRNAAVDRRANETRYGATQKTGPRFSPDTSYLLRVTEAEAPAKRAWAAGEIVRRGLVDALRGRSGDYGFNPDRGPRKGEGKLGTIAALVTLSYKHYRGKGGRAARLPNGVTLKLTVLSYGATSTWDGAQTLSHQLNLPSRLRRGGFGIKFYTRRLLRLATKTLPPLTR